jgi:hypothetical protein
MLTAAGCILHVLTGFSDPADICVSHSQFNKELAGKKRVMVYQ